MKPIRKFTGDWGKSFSWDGARRRTYQANSGTSVIENWMIGKAEGAENFAMRFYQLSESGSSNLESHPHDHGIIVLMGEGKVLIGEDTHPIATGDVIYIEPNIQHQLINTGAGDLGFICVIPAKRMKNGKEVWAEENIDFGEKTRS